MTATLERPAAPEPPPREVPPTAALSPVVGWVVALAVGLVAGLLRFLRLDLPAGRIFDEVYYSCDAQNLLRFGVEVATRSDPDDASVAALCEPTGEPGFVVHPPLGKWAIALGMRLLGEDELGWRAAAALAGTLTVVVLVRLVRRMTGSTVLGAYAGLLLAMDGLHLVQSRVAMLDVFLVLWVVAAVACAVADRDQVRARLAAGGAPGLRRPWLVGTGLCLGAAVGTKWSGLYFVAAVGLLVLAWEVGARRAAGEATALRTTLVRSVPLMLGLLVVLPVAVYTASWTGWFLSDLGWSRQHGAENPATGLAALVPEGLRSLWHYHQEVYRFHDGLSASHPYASRPLSWLVLARPVSYYYPQGIEQGEYGCAAAACSREVLAVGTPALWWAALPVVLVLAWRWATRRDWRAGAAVLLVATAVLPWVPADLDGRTMFLFYALPVVPFLCLALALGVGLVAGDGSSRRRRTLAVAVGGGHLALVVANLAWLYPVLAAVTIPLGDWQARMWFSSWI
ncbi:MAG TPA: phospholipid carrier-dependent glycosyltransferase [Mycobacteriales bacterium]|nr:phospholipid carrier-dependent glycosyltransferase [Mycobacteriales bacterium]